MADPVSVVFRGVREFDAAIDKMVAAQERESLQALNAGVKLIAAQARTNLAGAARGRGERREGPPGRETGALQRSVRWWGARPLAPGIWAARAGPSRRSSAARYSRTQELGNPRWDRTKGYPYLKPAEMFVRRELPLVFRRAWTEGQKAR